MLSIRTRDPDSLHPEDVKYSIRWKETKHLFTGEPTYWPSDKNKIPGLVDFCVTKGVPQVFAVSNHVLTYLPIILLS
jgi:hypothetical protein